MQHPTAFYTEVYCSRLCHRHRVRISSDSIKLLCEAVQRISAAAFADNFLRLASFRLAFFFVGLRDRAAGKFLRSRSG